MSKVWLITGSSRGLGRSLAEAVLAQGDQLVATARQPEQLNELVEKYGDNVRAIALDVTNKAQVQAAVATALEAFGRVDVLVNNAGYGNTAAIEDASEEDWRAQIETNLWGVIHATKAVLPVMRRQGGGRILQVSSIGGRLGSPGMGAYQTAKWGVEGFSEVLTREVGPLGIKVTLVEPGAFRTDWAGSSMGVTEPSEPYQKILGPMIEHRQQTAGKEPGDPTKAAQAIIKIANLENPPFRLLLGKDAVGLARRIDQAKLVETDNWEELSSSTDYDDATANSDTARLLDSIGNHPSKEKDQ